MDRTMIRRLVATTVSGAARATAGTHWAAMAARRSRLASALMSLALITTFTIAFAQVAFAASLALGTTSGLAGSTVSVSGEGFGPNTSVSLFFAGIPLGTGSSDSNGTLNMAFTVPEVPGATYVVFATSPSGGFLANAFFTIPGPGFTLTPTKGVAGTIVTVVTGGVTPNSVLHLDFAGIPEGTVASDSGGIGKACGMQISRHRSAAS